MELPQPVLGLPEGMRVAVGTEPTGFGGLAYPELWKAKAGTRYLPFRGGSWPIDHLEEALQQLLIPVQVTELLRYGTTEGGKGEVFQGVNILPWFTKDGEIRLPTGDLLGSLHWITGKWSQGFRGGGI